jgi:hypothetical protein
VFGTSGKRLTFEGLLKWLSLPIDTCGHKYYPPFFL